MNVYDRIKQCRIEKDITQEQLAKMLGYKSRSAIQKIEAGKRDLNQTKLAAFAKALGTTQAYLMGLEDDPQEKTIDDQIMALVASLDDDQKQALLNIAKQLNKNN